MSVGNLDLAFCEGNLFINFMKKDREGLANWVCVSFRKRVAGFR